MSDEEQGIPEVIETPFTPVDQPKKSNAGKIIGIIVAILLCCCALITAAVIYAGVWVWNTY